MGPDVGCVRERERIRKSDGVGRGWSFDGFVVVLRGASRRLEAAAAAHSQESTAWSAPPGTNKWRVSPSTAFLLSGCNSEPARLTVVPVRVGEVLEVDPFVLHHLAPLCNGRGGGLLPGRRRGRGAAGARKGWTDIIIVVVRCRHGPHVVVVVVAAALFVDRLILPCSSSIVDG